MCLLASTLSAAAAAIGSGLGLVDLDLARAELFSVQRADGLTGSIIVSEFDEAESARPTGFTINDDIHFAHFAVLAKEFANLILSCIKGEITNVELHSCYFHVPSLWRRTGSSGLIYVGFAQPRIEKLSSAGTDKL